MSNSGAETDKMISEKNKFLPVGTVVKLKEEEKRVMIIGFYPKAKEEQKIYHYVACLYPEGIIDSSKLVMFDDTKIEKICYMGFIDDEEKEFKNKLIKLPYEDSLKNAKIKK